MWFQGYFEHNTFDDVTPYCAWDFFDAGNNDFKLMYNSYIHQFPHFQ